MTIYVEARAAYMRLGAAGLLPSYRPEVQALDAYFKVPQYNSASLAPPVCPEPMGWSTDQYKCGKCGRIWDRDEQKPDCTL
jgi:hypothetical protein